MPGKNNKRKTKLVRIDEDLLNKTRKMLPGRTDAERSRIIFKNSLFAVEDVLQRFDERVSKKKKKKGEGFDTII